MPERNSRSSDRDTQLADALVMAAIRLTRTLRALNKSSALSGPLISALSVVVYAGRVAARDLARIEEVTPATISRLIAALEEQELITRERDSADTRVQWIEATARGRQLVRQGHRKRLAPLVAIIQDLPVAQRDALLTASHILADVTQQLAAGRRQANTRHDS